MRKVLLLSSSNCHGYSILEFARIEIEDFLTRNKIKNILFVPYAQKDYDKYTTKISKVFNQWGYDVDGIHTFDSPQSAVQNAKAIFIGGGNTFLLLKTLYENNLVNLIRDRVFNGTLLYMGSSAGTNVGTISINTTNDMPITFPPSFDGIKLVPFNINPHYIEINEVSTHKGETRDQRIEEYLEMPHARQVLGLKEGSLLEVEGNKAMLKGVAGAVLFSLDKTKTHYEAGTELSFLLQE